MKLSYLELEEIKNLSRVQLDETNTVPTLKMIRARAGRLGAQALNRDSLKKSETAQKATKTRLEKNPNFFAEMGKKGGHKKRKQILSSTQ